MKYCTLLFIILTNYCYSIGNDTIQNCSKGYELYENYKFNEAFHYLKKCYSKDTTNKDCLKKLADCSHNMGNYKIAKAYYNILLKDDSSNILILNKLAKIYSAELRYSKSINIYNKLLKIDSSNSLYHKKIGIIHLKNKHINKSIASFQIAHNLDPKDIFTISELSNLYLKLELVEQSENFLNKGLKLDESNVKLLTIQSKVAYKKRNYEIVLSTINKMIAINKDTSIYMKKLLAISNFHLGNYNESISTLENLSSIVQEESIFYYLGLAYREMEELDKSSFYFNKAIEAGITDNVSVYYTNLAITQEQNLQYKESIQSYQTAYKTSKKKILLYHLARNYDKYYKSKKTALLYYEKYLATNDSNNMNCMNYTKSRISELKEDIYFDLDTLN